MWDGLWGWQKAQLQVKSKRQHRDGTEPKSILPGDRIETDRAWTQPGKSQDRAGKEPGQSQDRVSP